MLGFMLISHPPAFWFPLANPQTCHPTSSSLDFHVLPHRAFAVVYTGFSFEQAVQLVRCCSFVIWKFIPLNLPVAMKPMKLVAAFWPTWNDLLYVPFGVYVPVSFSSYEHKM